MIMKSILSTFFDEVRQRLQVDLIVSQQLLAHQPENLSVAFPIRLQVVLQLMLVVLEVEGIPTPHFHLQYAFSG